MRYQVTITLDKGGQVQAKVVAENQADALARLEQVPEFVDFIKNSNIDKVDIMPIGSEDSKINPDRYTLQPSEESGWYVATDKDNLFIVRFKAHQYNETAQVKPIKNFPLDALKVATLLREVSEWLTIYHSDII